MEQGYEFEASAIRDLALKIHAGLMWCGYQIRRPFMALLNKIDETDRFTSYLNRSSLHTVAWPLPPRATDK